MKMSEILKEDGRIVKGVNTTVDVGPNEIKTQAAKFGNTVDKDGRPPTLSTKVKGKSTNVLFNLGLAEGIILKFERDNDMDVLHIMDTKEKHRVEVRGKPGYERGNHDSNDKLHQVLDALGKAANFAELMNGETVSVNPNHPHGTRAIRTAKDVLQTEASGPRMDPKDVEFDLLDAAEKRRLADEYKKLGPELAVTTWGAGLAQGIANFLGSQYLSALERFLLRQGAKRFTEMELACIEGGHDLNDLYEKAPEPKPTGDLFTQLENFADGKKKGKSRPGRVKRAGASCNGSVTSLRKRAKNASGEKAKMYHWCANMKSGRKKK
jgi:hypothetical protein